MPYLVNIQSFMDTNETNELYDKRQCFEADFLWNFAYLLNFGNLNLEPQGLVFLWKKNLEKFDIT